MPADPTAAVVVIGDEVLSGGVTDVNSVFLCRALVELGVAVRRVVVVPDVVDDIAAEVAACAKAHTHVLTTGGVGPTHDDVTMAGVAAALRRPLVRNAHAERVIRDFYGTEMAEAALRMADLPDGAELIVAEGIRFPVIRIDNVWVFPGSPHLLQAKFQAVREHFASAPFVTIRLGVNAGEPEIAGFLKRVQGRFPGVALGSYPQEPGEPVRLILTLKGKDEKGVNAARAALEKGLSGRLAPLPGEGGGSTPTGPAA